MRSEVGLAAAGWAHEDDKLTVRDLPGTGLPFRGEDAIVSLAGRDRSGLLAMRSLAL